MSAYLKFFELEHSPFDTQSQSSLVLGTQALRDAFAQIEAGLEEGAPRICVNGRAGLGKTSLARALPKLLHARARVVLLMNPTLAWPALRAAIVRQLDLEGGVLSRKSLMAARTDDQQLVLVIDAAERIGREALEHLDILLGYRTDDDRQLVHCVLLANLDQARELGDCPLMWWLDSLHTLQLEFAPIPAAGVRSYIVKHLRRAGWKGGELFSPDAAQAIHRLTGGVPRSVSELCERVLEEAAARRAPCIDAELVEEVCGERPAREPVAPDASAAEMLLETVVTPGPGVRSHGDAEADAPAPDAPGAEPASETSVARANAMPGRGAGLDAFFGPPTEPFDDAPRDERHEPAEADEWGRAHEDPHDVHAETTGMEPPRGGGWLRVAAVALTLLGLAVAGLWASGLLPSDPGVDPITTAAVPADSTARPSDEPPTPAERVARRVQAKASPDADGASVDATASGGRATGSAASGGADPATAPREVAEPGIVLEERPTTPGAESRAAANGDAALGDSRIASKPAASSPAAPASIDARLDASNERHF